MKLRTLLASSAAILATAVIAVAGFNSRQTDTGAFCLQESSGTGINDRWCIAANGLFDITPSTTADSAATNDYHEIAATTPVDTTGTNTHNLLTLDLDIGNATGGTNAARGLQIDAITGDAQVTTVGVNIGAMTGTGGTENAIAIAAGWDNGITNASPLTQSDAADFTEVAAADAGLTTDSLEVAVTTPVDTTGTNTHNLLTIDMDIGNASGGTNAARGIQIDAFTGDAQVTSTGINIGALTGTGATENAIVVGSGWDEGISLASPFITTADAEFDGTITIDSDVIEEEVLKFPGRGSFTVCGDIATVNANTVYYGPSNAIIDSATAGMLTCNTDAAGNTTEATADEPTLTATAIYPLGMVCRTTDIGATGSPLTFTLRSAAAAYMSGTITLDIADNELSDTVAVVGTTAIASGATVAVALTSAGDIGAGAFICEITYAF